MWVNQEPCFPTPLWPLTISLTLYRRLCTPFKPLLAYGEPEEN